MVCKLERNTDLCLLSEWIFFVLVERDNNGCGCVEMRMRVRFCEVRGK